MDKAHTRELFGLSQSDFDKINELLCENKNIKKAIIYGSRAKGNYKPGSDIDLTILGDISWRELNQLESDLDDAMLPYQFNLSLFEHIDNKELIDHINRIGSVFYQQNETFA